MKDFNYFGYCIVCSCLLGDSKILLFLLNRCQCNRCLRVNKNCDKDEDGDADNVLSHIPPGMDILVQPGEFRLLLLDLDFAYGQRSEPPAYQRYPREMENMKDFSIARISKNEFILVGGSNSGVNKNSGNCTTTWLLWKGILKEETCKIEWLGMDNTLARPLRNPICFKLQDNVYIVGRELSTQRGNTIERFTCDKYHFQNKRYSENIWPFRPTFNEHLVARRSQGKPSIFEKEMLIATDREETFAMILSTRDSYEPCEPYPPIIFSEKGGFEHVQSHSDFHHCFHLDDSNSTILCNPVNKPVVIF